MDHNLHQWIIIYMNATMYSKGLAPFEHQLHSLFLPPSELVYDPPSSAAAAGELGSSSSSNYSLCPELDLNKLTDERVLYLAEHYR